MVENNKKKSQNTLNVKMALGTESSSWELAPRKCLVLVLLIPVLMFLKMRIISLYSPL
ncbi:unnamed protein product, partial [Bubo scandiacus]